MLEQEKNIYICWKKLEANSTHQHIFLFWFWIRSCVERAVILNSSKEMKFVFICAFTFPFVAFFVFILYYSHDQIVTFQIWSEEDSFWQMIVNVINCVDLSGDPVKLYLNMHSCWRDVKGMSPALQPCTGLALSPPALPLTLTACPVVLPWSHMSLEALPIFNLVSILIKLLWDYENHLKL